METVSPVGLAYKEGRERLLGASKVVYVNMPYRRVRRNKSLPLEVVKDISVLD